jgi:hypothetical protein
LYGCETWSLTLREKHRFKVSDHRVLRRMFGPKTEEVEGGWRSLHNEELHDLYISQNIITVIKPRMTKLEDHVARTENMRNAYITMYFGW